MAYIKKADRNKAEETPAQKLARKYKEIEELEKLEGEAVDSEDPVEEEPEEPDESELPPTPKPPTPAVKGPDRAEVEDMIEGHLSRVSQLLGYLRGLK